ncbi:hypothetical protein [Gordonia soli]|uniref:2-isopropylmalate synthase LeuA allosteric (dimerisation) domain-containing protein n=1 Tax=Gordonia soli NBRC 108243 TaxID=1223545 RepID=M0QJC7_9ACTN|nr:hypothetical protein [Gordonia soli]GAC67537.1 hypothetical protein GS4_08_01220 [Gordonia soli NBRC 108243]
MTFQQLTDEYAPSGSISLGSWIVEPSAQDTVICRATISVGGRDLSLQARATGQMAAMTSMLHEIGAPVQINQFHQRVVDGIITTFLLCEDRGRECWALGDGATGDEANINALVAAANRLLAD